MGAGEFNTVSLLPVDYSVELLKLGLTFNVINVKAPEYLKTNVEMIHHRYHTKASNLVCVIPRVNVSWQTSFFYTSICFGNNLPIEIINVNLKPVLLKKCNHHSI